VFINTPSANSLMTGEPRAVVPMIANGGQIEIANEEVCSSDKSNAVRGVNAEWIFDGS
jgi:hypothetical protein